MKKFLLLATSLLIHGCNCSGVFAATVTNQVVNSPKTFERLQTTAPVTQVGDKNFLIETNDGENFLVNPGFEASGITTSVVPGWTLGGSVTAAAETTEVKAGKQSVKLTLASVNGVVISQDVTPAVKMKGDKLPRRLSVKTSLSTVRV